MKKIKIAHVITQAEIGGAQITTLLFLKYLDKDSYEPYLITSPGGVLEEELRFLPGAKM